MADPHFLQMKIQELSLEKEEFLDLQFYLFLFQNIRVVHQPQKEHIYIRRMDHLPEEAPCFSKYDCRSRPIWLYMFSKHLVLRLSQERKLLRQIVSRRRYWSWQHIYICLSVPWSDSYSYLGCNWPWLKRWSFPLISKEFSGEPNLMAEMAWVARIPLAYPCTCLVS